MRFPSRRRSLLVALALLLSGTHASANTFELLGGSPRAVAMGGAQTASSDDPAATFYNPALLARQHTLNLIFALSGLGNAATVELVNPNDPRTLDCIYCLPPPAFGGILGLSAPLQGKLKDRVSLGLMLHLPPDALLYSKFSDDDRPFWYLYDNNPNRLVLFIGAGVNVLENFDVGLGVQILADLIGDGASMAVDLFSSEVRLREINSLLGYHIVPNAGLSFRPSREMTLGFSWRSEFTNYIAIPASVNLEGVGTLAFVLSGYNHYTPHVFSGGLDYAVNERTRVAFDLNYELWSAAPTPYIDLVIDLSGETLDALGLDKALDLAAPNTPPGMANTLNARLGVEHLLNEAFTVRGGLYYRPTMVPRQDAPGTNIMDGNRLGLSGGFTYFFRDPLELLENRLQVDLGATASYLLPREAIKESTDTVPSYRYSAFVIGAQLGLSYPFGTVVPRPAPLVPSEEE